MKRETATPEKVERLLFGGAGWKGWQYDFPDGNDVKQLSEMGFEEAEAAEKTLLRMDADFLMASRLARLVGRTAAGLLYARGSRDFLDILFMPYEADFEEGRRALGPMLDTLDKTAKTEAARQMGATLRRIAERVRQAAGGTLVERARAAKWGTATARAIEDAATRNLLTCRTFAGWVEGARIAHGAAAISIAEAEAREARAREETLSAQGRTEEARDAAQRAEEARERAETIAREQAERAARAEGANGELRLILAGLLEKHGEQQKAAQLRRDMVATFRDMDRAITDEEGSRLEIAAGVLAEARQDKKRALGKCAPGTFLKYWRVWRFVLHSPDADTYAEFCRKFGRMPDSQTRARAFLDHSKGVK